MGVPERAALCCGMRFQRSEAFGSQLRDGEVRHYPRGKVHIAPPEGHAWQPLCGALLQGSAPQNKFVNVSARHDADWCPNCVAALFGGWFIATEHRARES